MNKALEIFETEAPNGRFLNVASPAKYDAAFVNGMKRRTNAICRKNAAGQWVWSTSVESRYVEAFRDVVAEAVARHGAPVGAARITEANLAYHMYDPNGALFG